MKSPKCLVTNPVLQGVPTVLYGFRTLQQNGGYVEYSRCSDIILRQVRMFSNQSINWEKGKASTNREHLK